ncbi:MAG: VOC family protein [Acidobacteria bacterium]|nr:VOC family protein [Acidobacteriota bacterium]
MARVAHFEIHADNPQRAIEFYGALFGWEFTQWGGQDYWLIKTGAPEEPGIDGGLMRRMGDRPQLGQAVNAYVCTTMVTSLDETITAGIELGATIALPKMPVPGVGWLAYFHDPEGNIFGAMQSDPEAK